MKIFKSSTFWTITMYIIISLISLGVNALIIMALIKFIFG